jgi:serine/threonine protein kinase
METETFIHIVMEYAASGEIFDYVVSRGRMSEHEAAAKFAQILSALNYCHNNRVVHRQCAGTATFGLNFVPVFRLDR